MTKSSLGSKAFCVGALALACGGAFGEVFTWTGGGEAGKWSDLANWSAAGGAATAAPNAGDAATFNSDVTITENFSIAEGMLTLTNAAGKKLYFDCVISGAGGISKGGDGQLHMKKNNEFTGKLISTGTLDCDKVSGFSSEVFMYEPWSLGKTAAEFDQDYSNGHGSRLNVMKPMTVPIPLKLTGDRISQGVIKFTACGAGTEVVFAEEVHAPFRWNDNVPANFTVRFKKDVTGVSNYFIMNAATNIFEGTISASTFYIMRDKVIRLASSDCLANVSGISFSGSGSRVYCDAVDALSKGKDKALKLPFSNDGKTVSDIWVDFCGNDQTPAGGFAIGNQPTGSDNYGFKSATAANLRIVTDDSCSGFHGQFAGMAGLEYAPPKGTSGFCFSNTVQTTRGTVKVASGAIRVKCGAGFPQLGKLEVGAAGTFMFDADASSFVAGEVVVADGGKLAIGAGKTMFCTAATIGDDVLAIGEYTKADYPDAIQGDGKLKVGAVTWNASKPTGNWSDGANWIGGKAPGVGQDAIIGAGVVTVDDSVAELKSIVVGSAATLVCGDWSTCVTAETVTVEGKVTCSGPFQTAADAPASRVWIRCKDLNVVAGGAIDVKGKGWDGGASGKVGICGRTNSGFGPGAPLGYCYGASHGGVGAMDQVSSNYDSRYYEAHAFFGYEYDDPFAPELPGSGGGYNTSDSKDGCAGGGAVKIEASGSVTVNGEICADSEAAVSVAEQSRGSGGAVWIACSAFSGSGRISAEGGRGYLGALPSFVTAAHGAEITGGKSNAGAGGMIRVECETASVAGMKISAAPGYYQGNAQGKGELTAATCDKWRTEADLGTVTFSNNLILDQLLGNGLSGRLVGVSDYEWKGNLNWTWGHVRFAGEGADVNVTGDLTVSGADSRLEVGGVSNGVRYAILVTRCGGAELNKLTVGGNFTVTDGAAFDVRAAVTNASMRWGGEVEVAGNFTVGANAIVRPWCDPRNLGASHFVVGGDFKVALGGLVDASRAGGAPYYGSGGAYNGQRAWLGTVRDAGWGLAGLGTRGAAHAGAGGPGWSLQFDVAGQTNDVSRAEAAGGKAFDYDMWSADYPGTGGGAGGYGDGGYGGGLVYVDAQGAVVVDGTVRADGWGGLTSQTGSNSSLNNYAMFGGGAGGGIHLAGSTFSGKGLISAHGGEGAGRTILGTVNLKGKNLSYSAGCGGGGAVAIVTGMDKLSGDWRKYKSDSAEEKHVAKRCSFEGVVDVGGGTNVSIAVGEKFSLPGSWGGVGSVRYVNYASAPGTAIIVR